MINEGKICVECYYKLAKGVCETCRNQKRDAVSDEIKQLRISENDEIIQTSALKEYFWIKKICKIFLVIELNLVEIAIMFIFINKMML